MSEGIAYGDYYLLGRLGSGGIAEVFLGKRLADGVGGPLLAVKRLLTQFSGDAEVVKIFEDEARLAKILRHPNIGEIYDHGLNNKQHFVVMEFVHGKDLQGVQQRARKAGERFPYAASAYIAAAIADALEYAHGVTPEGSSKAVVHRDLNPQKILVSYDGVPKLIHFGTTDTKSRAIEARLGSIKSRYGYLSPEQATSSPLDRRSDIFSLGVVLYELATGMAPFRGGSDAATLGKVARASYSPPELVNASIPRGLAGIIERAMQREPERRYASAGQMARALRDFIVADSHAVDAATLSRTMRELFRDDYERERQRVEQYRRLMPMSASALAGAANKPVSMADSNNETMAEGSRTSAAPQDERTSADDLSHPSVDDDEDTGIHAGEGDDTGAHDDIEDTGVHDDVRDTGDQDDVEDTGVHGDAVRDTSRHHRLSADADERARALVAEIATKPGDEDAGDEPSNRPITAPITTPITEPSGKEASVTTAQTEESSGFALSTEELLAISFEPTPSRVIMPAPVAAEDTKREPENPGNFELTLDEVVPNLDDEPTGADDSVPPAVSEAGTSTVNPWENADKVRTDTFNPQVVLSEGPTVVASTFFSAQMMGGEPRKKEVAGGASVFDEKTKVFDGIAELVKRTQPSGFGQEVAKNAAVPPNAAAARHEGIQLNEVLSAMSPLALATTVTQLATTITPLHVATEIAFSPAKALTVVALAPTKKTKKKKRKSGRNFFGMGSDDEASDDDALANAEPTHDDIKVGEPSTKPQPMEIDESVVSEVGLSPQPFDDEEYEEINGLFSRGDKITLIIAAFLGMLIMATSYVYALNIPLPDPDSIIDDR